MNGQAQNLAQAVADEGSWPAERLDADYNARATVGERFADEMRAYRQASVAVREPWCIHDGVVYDAQSGQAMDIFGVSGPEPVPVFVFIHGGYWRALSRLDSAMMAGMLAQQGIATAVIDYRLAPEVTLAEIVREVRAAIAFLWARGREFGIDPQQIHIGGSSAGGHLVGMLLAGGWHEESGVPEDVIRSALPVSGLFELAPLAATFPQEWLSLSEADVAQLSPIRHLPRSGCPVVLAWAGADPAGFGRQSAAFHQAWSNAGFRSRTMQVPERNHFNILMDLADAETPLAQALLGLIRG